MGGWAVGRSRSKGLSPGDWNSLGLGVDVQVLLKGLVADEAYVTGRGWEHAILGECPLHPEGGCGVGGHGSYARVWPEGCRIARFWCPVARVSISLLPESLAAGVTGSLDAIEAAAEAVEAHGLAAAVEVVLPADADDAVGLVGATRWVRRRARWVDGLLLALVTLMADRFAGVAPTLAGLRAALGVERVLVALRPIAERHLSALARPFGLQARARA